MRIDIEVVRVRKDERPEEQYRAGEVQVGKRGNGGEGAEKQDQVTGD